MHVVTGQSHEGTKAGTKGVASSLEEVNSPLKLTVAVHAVLFDIFSAGIMASCMYPPAPSQPAMLSTTISPEPSV